MSEQKPTIAQIIDQGPEAVQAALDAAKEKLLAKLKAANPVRIHFDPNDHTIAYMTLADETVVRGRLTDDGDFVADDPAEQPGAKIIAAATAPLVVITEQEKVKATKVKPASSRSPAWADHI